MFLQRSFSLTGRHPSLRLRALPQSYQTPYLPCHRLMFSTEPQGQNDWKKQMTDKYSMYRKLLPTALMAAGGVVTVYGTSRIVMWVTSSLMSWNFTDVAYMGFVGGLCTGFICSGMAYSAWRMSIIRPEVAFQKALGMIRSNNEVQRLLGGNIRGGNLRAYTIRTGRLGFDSDAIRPKWLYPRVQMLCQIEGSKGSAMTTLEAVRRGKSLDLDLITVDILESKEASASDPHPMIQVAGSEERLKVRGQLRQFLQTERVQYIEQSVPEQQQRS